MIKLKITVIILLSLGMTTLFLWADDRDFFQGNYNDLTDQQTEIFKWRDTNNFNLSQVYRQHFADKELIFPRQHVSKVKLFKNIPIVSVFTAKTLKQNQVDSFLQFCNDTANFDWGETTFGLNDAEYFFRLFNSKGEVVGKIYCCIADCGHIFARPFSPSMKFGALSKTGLNKINELIGNKSKWE